MAKVQEFLNKYGSEVRKNKEDVKIWCSNEDVQRPPICVERFQGGDSVKGEETPPLDYSQCIYCDVEPDGFWKFLYSDEWKDSVILRVFYGELYLKVDMKLNEMLKDETLSKHINCAYLKVKNNMDGIKFDLNPETVRIEFTYYGVNREKQPSSKAATFKPRDFSSDFTSLQPEEVQVKKKTRRRNQRIAEPPVQASADVGRLSTSANFLSINLAHYYCLNSLDIKERIESDGDLLEIKLKEKLGLSNDMFDISQASIHDPWQLGQRREPGQLRQLQKKIRPVLQRETINRKRKRPVKGKDGKWKIVEDDSEDKLFMRKLRREIGERLRKEMIKKGAIGEMFSFDTDMDMDMDNEEGEDVQDSFMLDTANEYTVETFEQMMKEERFCKFSQRKAKKKMKAKKKTITKMNSMKDIILGSSSVEGIANGEKQLLNRESKRKSNTMDVHKRRSEFAFKRISSMSKNIHEFALLVLGITDSLELYRTLLWMGRDQKNNQGKWRKWFESKSKGKFFKNLNQQKLKKLEDEEKGILKVDESAVGGEGDTVTAKDKTDGEAAKDKTDGEGKGKFGKDKFGKGKFGRGKFKGKFGKGKAGKGKAGKGEVDKGKVGKGKADKGKVGKGKAGKDKTDKDKTDREETIKDTGDKEPEDRRPSKTLDAASGDKAKELEEPIERKTKLKTLKEKEEEKEGEEKKEEGEKEEEKEEKKEVEEKEKKEEEKKEGEKDEKEGKKKEGEEEEKKEEEIEKSESEEETDEEDSDEDEDSDDDDDDEEDEDDEEDDESDEEEESEPPSFKYDWEISGEDNPVRLKTEIVVPDFKLDKYVIQSEMILKAMGDFIIRKERVTSSKSLTFTSLAFIRPSYAQKLFQVQ